MAEVQPVAKGSDVMADLTISHLTRLFWMREIYFVTGSGPQARFLICPSIFRQESSLARQSDLKDRAIRAETVGAAEMCFST